MSKALYKIVLPDGSPCHGGSGQWALPNGKPGKWMPKIKDIAPCERGYHLCRPQDLSFWMRHETHLYRAEARGERIDADDKIVVASARLVTRVETWTDDLLKAWATECALRAVRVTLPPALRTAKIDEALVVACERAETLAAAEAAARDAAKDAAWAAAVAAVAARDAAKDAAVAARDAAKDAAVAARDAGDAARAAWAAAGDAERRWQSDRLIALLGIES